MIPKDTQSPLFCLQGLYSKERWNKLGEEHTELRVPLAFDEGGGKELTWAHYKTETQW